MTNLPNQPMPDARKDFPNVELIAHLLSDLSRLRAAAKPIVKILNSDDIGQVTIAIPTELLRALCRAMVVQLEPHR